MRLELTTSALQGRRSPNWATSPENLCLLWSLELPKLLYLIIIQIRKWAREDLNFRPHAYQACALASWATSPTRQPNLTITVVPGSRLTDSFNLHHFKEQKKNATAFNASDIRQVENNNQLCLSRQGKNHFFYFFYHKCFSTACVASLAYFTPEKNVTI